MCDIPVFNYVDTFVIKSRGTIYSGPCPFDNVDRSPVYGRRIMVDGEVRVIKAMETFATFLGPRKGSPVGILLEDRIN